MGYLDKKSVGNLFDYSTQEAVKKLQRKVGLKLIDGIVGKNTLYHINNN